jgi:phenylacetate-coenzyme A ligase PaaK-like adenylate-forming protein
MKHFDDAVTDRRLTWSALKEHVLHAQGDEFYQNRYLVMKTSGSSGVPGLFPYSRDAVAVAIAAGMRHLAQNGVHPRPPWRTATIAGTTASHLTFRSAMLVRSPFLMKGIALPGDGALPELVVELNRFQPHALLAFPTVIVNLLREELAGRLRINPQVLSISGEVKLPELDDLLRYAWPECRLAEAYACTEIGMAGSSCPECGGIHLFEDLAIYETLDGDGRPVPAGESCDRLLVTNLINTALPLIRYEMGDRLRLKPEPNRCGRPWATVAAVEGRVDDMLLLPALAGGTVAVPPNTFMYLMSDLKTVGTYQVVHDPAGLAVAIIPAHGSAPDAVIAEVTLRVERWLQEVGAAPVGLRVRLVESLERVNGKLKLVRSAI